MADNNTAEAEVIEITRDGEIVPINLLDRAVAKGATVEVLERLMALQERWEANQARKAFDAAMSEVRKKLPAIVKNRAVDFTSNKGRTNYRYEDLHSVTEALSPVMAAHGLSFRWKTESGSAEEITVICIVSHAAGHTESTSLTARHDHSGNKNPIQAMGSTVTYLQRYTLKAALGVAAAEDDDGRQAQPEQQKAKAAPLRQSAQQEIKRTVELFEQFELSQEDLEEFVGKPAAEWGNAESKALGAFFKDQKAAKAAGEEQRRRNNEEDKDSDLPTPAQMVALTNALEASTVDEDGLNRWLNMNYGVATLAELSAEHFDDVTDWLKSQKSQEAS